MGGSGRHRRRARVGPGGAVASSLSTRAGGVVRSTGDVASSAGPAAGLGAGLTTTETNLDPVQAYKERKAAARRLRAQRLDADSTSTEMGASACRTQSSAAFSAASLGQGRAQGSPASTNEEQTITKRTWVGATPQLLLQEWMQRAGLRGQPRLAKQPSSGWLIRLGKGHHSQQQQQQRGSYHQVASVYSWNGEALSPADAHMVDTDEKAAKLAALWVLASVDRQRNHALRLEPSLRPFWARFVAAHEAKEKQIAAQAAEAANARARARAEAKKAYREQQLLVPLRLEDRTRAAVEEALVCLLELDASASLESMWMQASRALGPEQHWLWQQLQELGFDAEAAAEATARCVVEPAGSGMRSAEQQRSQALDWLCLHLDEDELPPSFRPEQATEVVAFRAEHAKQALEAANNRAKAVDPKASLDPSPACSTVRTPCATQKGAGIAKSNSGVYSESERLRALEWLVNTMALMNRAQGERLLLANRDRVLDAAHDWIRELLIFTPTESIAFLLERVQMPSKIRTDRLQHRELSGDKNSLRHSEGTLYNGNTDSGDCMFRYASSANATATEDMLGDPLSEETELFEETEHVLDPRSRSLADTQSSVEKEQRLDTVDFRRSCWALERQELEARFGRAFCWTREVLPSSSLPQPLSSIDDHVDAEGFEIDLQMDLSRTAPKLDTPSARTGAGAPTTPTATRWGLSRLCGHLYGYPETLPILWFEDSTTTTTTLETVRAKWRPPRRVRRAWLRSLHGAVLLAMDRSRQAPECVPARRAVLAPTIYDWLTEWQSKQGATPTLPSCRACDPDSRPTHLRPGPAGASRSLTARKSSSRKAGPSSSFSSAGIEPDPALDRELQQRERERLERIERRHSPPALTRLPARQYQQAFLSLLAAGTNPVLIQAETGSGKTTQCPAMILENALLQGRASQTRILVTQPRRIAAITVAKRVADERGERLTADSETPQRQRTGTDDNAHEAGLVGYQVRLQGRISPHTRLAFCTTGIVLRMLQQDPSLMNISHLILDEVHERSAEMDMLLCCVRRLLASRSDLQVVFMSATANAASLERYLGAAAAAGDASTPRTLRVLQIPGRTFPVMIRWLEDLPRWRNGSAHGTASVERSATTIAHPILHVCDDVQVVSLCEQDEHHELDTGAKDAASWQAFQLAKRCAHQHPTDDADHRAGRAGAAHTKPLSMKQLAATDARSLEQIRCLEATAASAQRTPEMDLALDAGANTETKLSPMLDALQLEETANAASNNAADVFGRHPERSAERQASGSTAAGTWGENVDPADEESCAASDAQQWTPLGFSSVKGASLALVEFVVRRLDEELSAQEARCGSGKRGAILVFLPGVVETEQLCRRLHRLGGRSSAHRPDAELSSTFQARGVASFWALPLHANQTAVEQERVFAEAPDPLQQRKVICATNVAESSITVPDVVAVIDTCRVRSLQMQPATRGALQLRESWCSKASAAQRAGRAGRVTAGICWRLIPRDPFWLKHLPEDTEPELVRTPLERWILWLLGWSTAERGARHSLEQVVQLLQREMMTAPPQAHTEAAIVRLWQMGALQLSSGDMLAASGLAWMADGIKVAAQKTRRDAVVVHDEASGDVPAGASSATQHLPRTLNGETGPSAELWSLSSLSSSLKDLECTPLGCILSALPLDPTVGKLLLYGAIFGCLSWSLTAAAVLIEGSPFARITGGGSSLIQRHRLETYSSFDSDIASAVYVWQQWQTLRAQAASAGKGALAAFLAQNALSERVMEQIQQTRLSLERTLDDIGLEPGPIDWHENEQHQRIHRAVLYAALVPQLLRATPVSGKQQKDTSSGKHGNGATPNSTTWQLFDETNTPVWLHPSSLVRLERSEEQRQQLSSHAVRWFTYAQRVTTSRAFVQQVSAVPVFAVLLFSGRDIRIEHEAQRVIVDGWIRFRCAARTAVLLRSFRQQTEKVLSAYFASLMGPGRDTSTSTSTNTSTSTSTTADPHWPVRCRTLRSILKRLVAYD